MKSSPKTKHDTKLQTVKQTTRKNLSDTHQAHADFFERALRIIAIAIAFVKFALEKEKVLSVLDLAKLKVERNHFFDFNTNKDSYADMVYRIPLKNDPTNSVMVYVVLEHKSYNDPMAVFQLAYYSMQILYREVLAKKKKTRTAKGNSDKDDTVNIVADKTLKKKPKLPLVIPILIYHRAKKFTGPIELKQLFPKLGLNEEHLLNYKPILIDLNDINEEDFPFDPNDTRLNIVLKALKVLCQGCSPQKAAECIEQLMPYTHGNPEYIEFAKITLDYFMSILKDGKSWLERIIKENQQYEKQKLIAKGGVDMLLSFRNQYVEEGYGKGIQKSVLQALKIRFSKVPVAIQKRIQQIQDEIVLESLFQEAILCQSLDEFKESLP